jgi:hypothetical protein
LIFQLNNLRDTLFGDLSLDQWPTNSTGTETYPWTAFLSARKALSKGDTETAVATWKAIAADASLEPRHALQAWHFLRQQGQQPEEAEAKLVLGVVLEVALHEGLDLLAVYPDHSARYYNFSGAGAVWERPDDSLDDRIDDLLMAAGEVVQRIGPHDGGRPGVPPEGHVRLNFLTPSGLHFGQAPMEALAADELGGPVLQHGAELMQAMIEKSQK